MRIVKGKVVTIHPNGDRDVKYIRNIKRWHRDEGCMVRRIGHKLKLQGRPAENIKFQTLFHSGSFKMMSSYTVGKIKI